MNITLFFRRTQSYVAVLLILTLLVPSFAAAQGGGGADSGSAANDSGDEGEQGNPNDSHEGEDSEDDEDEEEEEEKDGAGKNYAGDPSANLGLGPSNPGDPADANGNFQDDSIDQGYDTGDWSGYSDGLGGPSFSGAPSGGDPSGSGNADAPGNKDGSTGGPTGFGSTPGSSPAGSSNPSSPSSPGNAAAPGNKDGSIGGPTGFGSTPGGSNPTGLGSPSNPGNAAAPGNKDGSIGGPTGFSSTPGSNPAGKAAGGGWFSDGFKDGVPEAATTIATLTEALSITKAVSTISISTNPATAKQNFDRAASKYAAAYANVQQMNLAFTRTSVPTAKGREAVQKAYDEAVIAQQELAVAQAALNEVNASNISRADQAKQAIDDAVTNFALGGGGFDNDDNADFAGPSGAPNTSGGGGFDNDDNADFAGPSGAPNTSGGGGFDNDDNADFAGPSGAPNTSGGGGFDNDDNADFAGPAAKSDAAEEAQKAKDAETANAYQQYADTRTGFSYNPATKSYTGKASGKTYNAIDVPGSASIAKAQASLNKAVAENNVVDARKAAASMTAAAKALGISIAYNEEDAKPVDINGFPVGQAFGKTYSGPKGIPSKGLNRAAEYAAVTYAGFSVPGVKATEAEIEYAARVALAETRSIRDARGNINTTGLRAVADVIGARVRSQNHPNTVKAVLEEKYQFEPVLDKVNLAQFSKEDVEEAKAIMAAALAGIAVPVAVDSVTKTAFTNFANIATINGPKSEASRATKESFNAMAKNPGSFTITDNKNHATQHTFGNMPNKDGSITSRPSYSPTSATVNNNTGQTFGVPAPNTSPAANPNTSPNTNPNTSPNTDPNTSPNTNPNTSPNTDPNTSPNTNPNTSGPTTNPGATGRSIGTTIGTALGGPIGGLIGGVVGKAIGENGFNNPGTGTTPTGAIQGGDNDYWKPRQQAATATYNSVRQSTYTPKKIAKEYIPILVQLREDGQVRLSDLRANQNKSIPELQLEVIQLISEKDTLVAEQEADEIEILEAEIADMLHLISELNATKDQNPLVVNEYNEIIYSNGKYAPLTIAGTDIHDVPGNEHIELPEYVYFVQKEGIDTQAALEQAGEQIDKSFMETITSSIYKVLTGGPEKFTLDDVALITHEYIDTESAGEEYFVYSIDLHDGSTVTVEYPAFTNSEIQAKAFSDVGYTGDPLLIVANSLGIQPRTPKPTLSEKISAVTVKAFGSLFANNDSSSETHIQYADLGLPSKTTTQPGSEGYTIDDITSLNIFMNAGVHCPDVPGVDQGYLYEVDYGDTILANARCGSGTPETFIAEVARHLFLEYNFAALDVAALSKKTVFNFGWKIQATPESITNRVSVPSPVNLMEITPALGTAPLTVTATTRYGDAGAYRPSIADGQDTVINFGDGSDVRWLQCVGTQSTDAPNTCGASSTLTHTYTKPGVYTISIQRQGGFCAEECTVTTLDVTTVEVVAESERTTEPAAILDPNAINLEVQVRSDNGSLIRDWTTKDITIKNNDQLAFRWSAPEYKQCLPFLADNGAYSLSRRDSIAMTSGNTEDEGYEILERTGAYSIECSETIDAEVDIRSINVIIR